MASFLKLCVAMVGMHRARYSQEKERHSETARGHGERYAGPRPRHAFGALAGTARHIPPARRPVQPCLEFDGVLVRRPPHRQ